MKDVQATVDASNPQKRISSTSKQYISSLFVGKFYHLDPDPAEQINADPDP
jgi:hypothetical protein